MLYKHPKKHNVLPVIAIAFVFVAGFVAYDYTSIKSVRAVTDDSALVASGAEGTEELFNPQQLAMLAKIESLKLDGSIFKDEVFLGLIGSTIDLGTQPSGRPNPFLPLPGGASPSTAQTPARR
jgi:hypothetical protein